MEMFLKSFYRHFHGIKTNYNMAYCMCKYHHLIESVTCRCFSWAAQSSLQKFPWERRSVSFFCWVFIFCYIHTMKGWDRQERERKMEREDKNKINDSEIFALGISCMTKSHIFTAIRLANKIEQQIHHVYCIMCVKNMNSTWWMRSSCLASVTFSAFSILLCSCVWITSSPAFMFPSLATETGTSWENSKRV